MGHILCHSIKSSCHTGNRLDVVIFAVKNALLQKTYDSFVKSGANLTGEAKEKFRQLNTELSILTLRFSQNLLKETNNYELALTKKQVEGLPESRCV